MKNKVFFGDEAIKGAKIGVDIVYNTVALTLGAAGRNVGYMDYSPKTSNDGLDLCRQINPEDEHQKYGAELIKQVSEKQNEEVGDGTTTVVVLAHAMIEEGLKKVSQGKNPMVLKREIDAAIEKAIKEIKPIPVKSDEDLFNIANISMENPEIAKLIAESVKKAGPDGRVEVEEGNGTSIEKEELDGISFDQGYISPYMITNPHKMEAVLKDVDVLISDKTFNLNKDLFHIMNELANQGKKQLFVVCGSLEGEMLSSVIANRVKGKFHLVAVKKPFDKEMLEDIAILTGGETITVEKGIEDLTALHTSYLGKARKVTVRKGMCSIVGEDVNKEKVEERVKSIKEQIKNADGYAKENLKKRLAKLIGGVTLLKVGAHSDTEMKYLKLKVDDAVAATKAAVEDGIVPGGGRCLYDISLLPTKTDGEEIVAKACGFPIRKIIENSGDNPDEILSGLKSGEVYNVLTRKIENPLDSGLIDPFKVEKCALKNASSMAGMFLTLGGVIVNIPDTLPNNQTTI